MPRGLAAKTQALIDAGTDVLAATRPATVRSVGYQLFIKGLIPDMSKSSVDRVGRALVTARERGLIPWSWVVDEHRAIEAVPSWSDPDAYAATVRRSYRKDWWADQPVRLLLVSEKGTLRGVLKPVLDAYGVGLLVVHGFASATVVHDLAADSVGDDRRLVALYVGDHDPSGRHMSDVDLPRRIACYGGRLAVRRLALTEEDVPGLPSFAAETKRGDPRHGWFVARFGQRCVELDAVNPNVLRERVRHAIEEHIDWGSWERASATEEAELASLTEVLGGWKALTVFSNKPQNTGMAP